MLGFGLSIEPQLWALIFVMVRIGATFIARAVGIVTLFGVSFWLSPSLEVIGVSIAVLVNAFVVAILLGLATQSLLRVKPSDPARV